MSAVVSVATSIPITLYDGTGAGRAGLTVTSVARKAGSATTVSATSVTDRSNGDYDALFTFPSVGTWRVTSTATIDGDTVPDLTDVNVVTAAQNDPASSLSAAISALSGVSVTLVSPLSVDGGRLTLYQGDSYAAAQSRQLSWSLTGQPDLTTATVTLKIVSGVTLTKTATSITNPATGSPTVTFVLTVAETAAFTPARVGEFDVSATIGSDVFTLVRGVAFVREDL